MGINEYAKEFVCYNYVACPKFPKKCALADKHKEHECDIAQSAYARKQERENHHDRKASTNQHD